MSAADSFRELAPLAALDALEAEEARAFEEHARGCDECRRERDAFADTAGRLAFATGPVTPPPGLRARVLGAIGAPARAPRRVFSLAVAATLAAGFAVGFVAMQQESVERQRRVHAAFAHDDLMTFLSDARSRSVSLSPLPAAPRAGGRVIWNAETKRAMLFASGLDPAPPGKAYEVWVIAGGPPVASGTFQADDQGRLVATLPWLDQTAEVKTFAVTLEPAGGMGAPTGPMVMMSRQ